jgi:hypothetical protein
VKSGCEYTIQTGTLVIVSYWQTSVEVDTDYVEK